MPFLTKIVKVGRASRRIETQEVDIQVKGVRAF
jgi:hypothetical protein